jgi:hypothetical protein
VKVSLPIIFLLCLSLVCHPAAAQKHDIEITDTLGGLVAVVDKGVIADAKTQSPLLTVRGNMVFEGSSENKDDLVLLVRVEDIFSKGAEPILKKDMKTAVLNVAKGKFYLGNSPTYDDAYLVGYYKADSKGNLGIYSGNAVTPVAYLKGNNMSTGELCAIFYLFMLNLEMDKAARERVPVITPLSGESADNMGSGTIKRLWGSTEDEYVWDGRIIKRKWNSFDFEEWSFDGKTLKRVWYQGEDDYTWDGKTLSKKWNTGTDEFEFDGTTLRRKWNTGMDEYSIQGNIVKRLWNTNNNDEWEVDGDIPVPVIAMVVFGLLRQ